MVGSRGRQAPCWAVALLLPIACLTQSPRFTFNPSNYHPPAGEASPSPAQFRVVEGNNTPIVGRSLNTSEFHFNGASLSLFPGLTFIGNKACSPHGYQDYLAIRSFVVPTLEVEGPAIRTWRQTGDGSYPLPQRVIWFDLQSGNIVQGNLAFNWTQQARLINYTLITPDLVDLDQYRAVLDELIDVVQGLATGQPPWYAAGSVCNDPIPILNETWTYLQSVKADMSNASNVSGGLRPTEVRLRSGCIEEIEANYKGDAVSGILPNVSGGDECCQACRNQTGCNVWVWCPLTSGCATGSGTFPFLGCQLKYQANVSTSAAPQPLPDAWSRGPPTGFVSGRLAYT